MLKDRSEGNLLVALFQQLAVVPDTERQETGVDKVIWWLIYPVILHVIYKKPAIRRDTT